MNLDLHVHTRRYSGCSVISPEQLLQRARETKLDGVMFSEHNRFWPVDEIEHYRKQYPDLKIFNGAEIDVPSLHHVLTIVPEPANGHSLFRPASARTFLSDLENMGGVGIAAHPFRYYQDYDQRNQNFSLHGVEIASSNMCSTKELEKARQLTHQWGAEPTVNSDAHSLQPLGKFFNQFDREPADEEELIELIRKGAFSAREPELL